MNHIPEYRKQFVQRLNKACDDATHVPPPFQGRQRDIAIALKATPEAISKWFKGDSIPSPDKMLALAKFLGVDAGWLATGTNPPAERRIQAEQASRASAAVLYARGAIGIAGFGHASLPANDARAEVIDFYATIGGIAHAIHVELARQVEPGVFEIPAQRRMADVRYLIVVPVQAGEHVFLELVHDLPEPKKAKSNGMAFWKITKGERGHYYVGNVALPRIKTFLELS